MQGKMHLCLSPCLSRGPLISILFHIPAHGIETDNLEHILVGAYSGTTGVAEITGLINKMDIKAQ